MPVWHASVALLRAGRDPKPVAAWSRQEKADAWALASALLRGVGTGANHSAEGGHAIHLRRQLSGDELAMLKAEWLALPAVDAE